MKEMEYVDEATFQREMIQFSDEHYDLAKEICEKHGTYGDLIVRSDKKSLCFAVNKYAGNDRAEKELGKNLYRVTIEKIEPYKYGKQDI